MKPAWLTIAAGFAAASMAGACDRLSLDGGGAFLEPAAVAAAPHPAEPRRLVELFSWWYAPGEAEAVEAWIGVHRNRYPSARIFNSSSSSSDSAQKLLVQRLREGDPPDLFQLYVRDKPPAMADKRKPLDALFDQLGLRDVIFPEVLRQVTENGHIYSMPVNVHRENSLFYNRKIFAEHHLQPPATLKDFLSICRTLKAAGVTPVAAVYHGYILRTLFNSLAAGRMGSERYRDYFTGKSPADVALLRDVVDVFAEVIEQYTNADAGEDGVGWTTASQAVFNGEAAMFLHADWVKGYLVQLGWNPGVDFGQVGSPGASDLFLFGIDAFALPIGAKNEPGALDFLATITSRDGQAEFNRIKGSSPIRRDVPRDRLDILGRATLDDLEHAKIRMLVPIRREWEDALVAFTKNHDRGSLLRAFLQNPPGA